MAEITELMRKRLLNVLSVNYADVSIVTAACNLKGVFDEYISYTWIEKYKLQCEADTSILEIVIDGYTFLWDETYERVVVAYGVASEERLLKVKKRDKSRIAYYYRNFIKKKIDAKTDTGHFIAHSIGGGVDMNLFPQKREVNRGYSSEGKVYRKMESYVLQHPETLVFSRPIYFDETWQPFFLEYGIVKEENQLWVNTFDNR